MIFQKITVVSVACLILLLMVVYPLSKLMSQDRSAETTDLPTKDSTAAAFGQLPVRFIQNQGQLDGAVEYYVKSPAQTLYFTQEGIVFDLTRHNQTEATGTAGGQVERLVFSLDFLGANNKPAIEGTGKDGAVVNYFTGSDPLTWRTDIPTYREVVYHDVYPAIDLRLRGERNALEYDFVVKPGAKIEDITLAYNGIDSLAIENGELVAGTAFGDINQDRPYIYQQIGDETVKVAGGFRLDGGNTYGFYATAYDERYPLIIDPTLAYSTYLGGNLADQGRDIAVDATGYAYVTGNTGSSNFPTKNPYQGTYAGSTDVFVTKLSTVGNDLIYSTYLGGSVSDIGQGIALDSSGCAYIIGYTTSSDFPTRNPYQATYAGNNDAFITKLSAAGNSLIYSTYLGGSFGDYGYDIAVDAAGCAYVTGQTYASNFPTQNPYQGTYAGGGDVFVTSLSAAGNSLIYSTYLGGSGGDSGNGIAVDAAGCAYVTGYATSSNFPTQTAFQGTFGGVNDAFVTKFSAAGNSLIYSTYLGGGATDSGSGISVDAAGCAYITGHTQSGNFPTQNPYQGTIDGNDDAFVTKLTAAGNGLIYSTYLGGSDLDTAGGIAVDAAGCAYVSGRTLSTNFPTRNPYQSTNHGIINTFVTRLSVTGNGLSYSTYLGGSLGDQGSRIAVDAEGGAYVIGQTNSTDFPTKNPYQGTLAGGVDVFVAKFSLSPPAVTTTAATGVGLNSATINMSFSLGDIDIVYVRFAYKTVADSTWTYTPFVFQSVAGTYAEDVAGLLPGIPYDFKAQVKYLANVIDGNTLQFITIGLPAKPRVSPSLPRQLNPAQMSLKYLNVYPQQASTNQPVIITTNVVNTGDEAGNYNVVLKINGQVEQTRMVSVGPRVAHPVKFTVTKSQPGTYTVDIAEQRGSFTVLGTASTSGEPGTSGWIAIVLIAVLVLAAVVVLLLVFR
jgi:hypothetical protein